MLKAVFVAACCAEITTGISSFKAFTLRGSFVSPTSFVVHVDATAWRISHISRMTPQQHQHRLISISHFRENAIPCKFKHDNSVYV